MSKTRTFACTKEQSLGDFGGSNRGSGKDDHAPIGKTGSNTFRELLQFNNDWSGMYQVLRVQLRMKRTGEVHLTFGGTPRVLTRRIDAAWDAGGGDENSWAVSAPEVYPGPSTTGTSDDSGALAGSQNGWSMWDITAAYLAYIPPAVLKPDGTANSSVTGNRGVRVISFDEASTARSIEFYSRRAPAASRPEVLVTYDDNVPPDAPEVLVPEPQGSRSEAAVLVATTGGRELTVQFNYNDPDDTVPAKAELQAFPDAITDATAASTTPTVTTGPINLTATGAFKSAGPARRYSIKVTGLPARTVQRYRLRVQDPAGAWSPWTSVDNGRPQTAYLPGVPLQPSMTTNPESAVISGTINSADGSDYVRRVQFDMWLDNPDGSQTPLWDPVIDLGDSPSLRRPAILYAGVALSDGDKVRWRQKHWNRDLVEGPYSPYYTTTMKAQVGPTITPADTTTKLLSRSGPITIASASFDGYQYKLFRGDTQIYDSGLVTIVAATSVVVSLPTTYTTWGDTLGIEAYTRPAGTTALGPPNPRSFFYIDALPTTSVVASDGAGNTGAIIPTTDIEWALPYNDPDRGNYGEDPASQELELRVAASPAGTGTLVIKRTSIDDIVEDVRTGRVLHLMTSATGWVGDTNVAPGTDASFPTDYSGSSLELVFASSATDRGARYTFPTPLDLSAFPGGTLLKVHRRITSITNLTWLVLRLETTASDYREYGLANSGAAINTWAEVLVAIGNPRATAGTFDPANVPTMRIFADVTAAFAADVQLRDLRIGTTQTARTVPDGHLAPEASYDARARYRDDATPKASTTLAASSIATATNVKVAAVTNIAIGDWLTLETAGFIETRQVTVVGTAGAGGTGVTVSEGYTYAHTSAEAAVVYYWGPWTAWVTTKASIPPVVAAATPADAATVTDPTQSLVFTFTSAGSKLQASHTVRLYRRDGTNDELIYERTTADALLTDVLPTLVLEDATVYAWEIEAADTDGLTGTTTRRSFTTDFTAPVVVADLAGTTDDTIQAITLTWTASVDPLLDHYRAYWRDELSGQDVRIDLGPIEVDDGRVKLVDATFTYYGGRLGSNSFAVTVHNGSLESEQSNVDVTLGAIRGGSWAFAGDGDERYTFAFDPDDAPRTTSGAVETFRPPGRPYPVHLHWGQSGRSVSARFRYLPGEDGNLATALGELFSTGRAFWVKAPEPFAWDVMRVRVSDISDTVQAHGFVSVSVGLDEVARSDS